MYVDTAELFLVAAVGNRQALSSGNADRSSVRQSLETAKVPTKAWCGTLSVHAHLITAPSPRTTLISDIVTRVIGVGWTGPIMTWHVCVGYLLFTART